MDQDDPLFQLAGKIDRLNTNGRLADLNMFLTIGPEHRMKAIGDSLSRLRPGPYLLGCGPFCCDLMRVTVDTVTIGRTATPEEQHADTVADILVNDTPWLMPREVSRIHASILREDHGEDEVFSLRDERSTTGTYLNGRQVTEIPEQDQLPNPAGLHSGDVISLGSSGVNSFIFFVL